MSAIGKIERVPLREVWAHEAYDLTRWLEENVDVLDGVVRLGLEAAEREQTAGAFSVDLVARDADGRTVVIENQLERSDHDHLGKLITYTAMTDAKVAIEGIRIGESLPAPLLTLIVQPSEGGRQAGEVKKEIAEGASIRRRFWTGLLERARRQTRLHGAISPSDNSWVSASAGKSGLEFNYSVTQHAGQVELYIDRGSGEANLAIFRELLAHKDVIEDSFGGPLDWQPLEGRQACRIRKRFDGIGYRDQERWGDLQSDLIETMIRLERALRPHIDQLTA